MTDPAAKPRPAEPGAASARALSPDGFRERFAQVAAGLDAARTPGERERAKQEIIALFKGVEASLAELSQIREEIRGLVDRYKRAVAAAAPQPAQAPQFTGQRPALHADHIGASTFIEKGWSLISLGDHAGAIQALEKALALSPGAVEAQSLLGWAQMLSEQYDEALATFSRVLMNEPANALARINVGYICLRKGIFGEAIEHLSKAIRLDNDRKATLYAHYYLGLVYFEREMYEDAQTFFRKTLRLGPNLIEAWFELGRALWFGGQRDEALEAWTEGHRANKFNPWARRCREMLDLVESGGAIPRKLLT
jgi:tetratricopeptide (TPR) repeat protein